MRDDGISSALALVTSAYSSYSGCRQYRENIVGGPSGRVGEGAPEIDKLRSFTTIPALSKHAPTAYALRCSNSLVRTAPRGDSAQHSVFDGRDQRLRKAVARDTPGWWRKQSAFRIGIWFTKAAADRRASLGWSPTFWIICGDLHAARDRRRNCCAARLRVGSHGSALRSRHRGPRTWPELGHEDGTRGNGWHASGVRRHDPPAYLRAAESGEPKLAVGLFPPNHDVCPADCCPAPQRAGRPPASEARAFRNSLDRFHAVHPAFRLKSAQFLLVGSPMAAFSSDARSAA